MPLALTAHVFHVQTITAFPVSFSLFLHLVCACLSFFYSSFLYSSFYFRWNMYGFCFGCSTSGFVFHILWHKKFIQIWLTCNWYKLVFKNIWRECYLAWCRPTSVLSKWVWVCVCVCAIYYKSISVSIWKSDLFNVIQINRHFVRYFCNIIIVM